VVHFRKSLDLRWQDLHQNALRAGCAGFKPCVEEKRQALHPNDRRVRQRLSQHNNGYNKDGGKEKKKGKRITLLKNYEMFS
jgi:hypothetical protein